ncbi:MAG: glutamine amidotransferase [Hyphomicrobiaceae bacterium]
MKFAIAIRHVGFEDLGAFAPALRSAGYQVHYWDIGEQQLWTLEPVKTDLLLVLGGPIGAYEDEAYPFLAEEIAILEQRLAANRPTLGICLGAQLIARAAGARVYPSGAKEIGFAPIRLTEAGRSSCLAPFAEAPIALHWHGDTFDLPAGAARLASTDLCENQAFAMGPNIVGFQFHPEASSTGFEKWLVGHAAELAAARIDVPRLRAEAQTYGPELERKAQAVLSAWLGGLEV